MNAYEVIVTLDAELDIRDICDQIAYVSEGRGAALAQIRSIRHAIEGLKDAPARFDHTHLEKLQDEGVPRLFVGNYLVYYRVDEGSRRVYVLNVLLARKRQMHVRTRF